MLTYKEMERLPENERAVIRASHDYYQALLRGAPTNEQHRLRQTWLEEIHRRWPDTLTCGGTTHPDRSLIYVASQRKA